MLKTFYAKEEPMLYKVVITEPNGSRRGVGSKGDKGSKDKVDFGHHEDTEKVVNWVDEEGLLILVILSVGDSMKDSGRMRDNHYYFKNELKKKGPVPEEHAKTAPTIFTILSTNINIPLIDF